PPRRGRSRSRRQWRTVPSRATSRSILWRRLLLEDRAQQVFERMEIVASGERFIDSALRVATAVLQGDERLHRILAQIRRRRGRLRGGGEAVAQERLLCQFAGELRDDGL